MYSNPYQQNQHPRSKTPKLISRKPQFHPNSIPIGQTNQLVKPTPPIPCPWPQQHHHKIVLQINYSTLLDFSIHHPETTLNHRGGSPLSNTGWNSTYDHFAYRPQLQPQYKFSKMDFPRFDGENPCGWISKADNFFLLNPIMDSTTKVIYATLYLDDEADYWYQTIQVEYPGLSWELFISSLLKRFSTWNQANLIV